MVNNEQTILLLELLDKEEVQVKLFQIFSEKLRNGRENSVLESIDTVISEKKEERGEIEILEKKINKLQSLLEKERESAIATEMSLKKANLHLEESKSAGTEIIDKLEHVKNVNRDLEKRIDVYRDTFENDLRIQNLYQGFSELTKTSLTGIFKDTSIKGLIACGIQEKNISNLWDYIKNESIQGSNPDEDKLVKLFELLFSQFTLAYPNYKLETSIAGDDYDNQNHIKHHGSTSSSGVIKKITLPGYMNIKTGKIIKKSLIVI